MKYQVLFSLKKKKKKYSRLLSAVFVMGALCIKMNGPIAENLAIIRYK